MKILFAAFAGVVYGGSAYIAGKSGDVVPYLVCLIAGFVWGSLLALIDIENS